ncbi:MAG: spore coat associated protein CotJA [Syntrophomonadaceae bacterium]|jgi:hypothetical protein|nr:spore coat associated protein CotJA [Syntrophomonadaceae bacterium]HHY08791.1 spore coat associated protein CotJA [Mycobacteriales bacterium]
MSSTDEMQLARAYFKIQQYTKRYSPMEGLQRGTIFPELFMPYGPRRGRKKEGDGGKKGVKFFGQRP